MPTDNDSEQRLRDAGVIVADEPPPEYEAVVRGLTRDEVDVIVAVKRRLDEAGRVSGVEPGECWFVP
jgi:hypothetical protein